MLNSTSRISKYEFKHEIKLIYKMSALLSTALNGISDKWVSILNNEILSDILNTVSKTKLTPSIDKIFEFARLTDLSNIKIVIIGQDPYPKAGDAHGLAFSCMSHIPASLNNIYKCLLKHKLINDLPETGNLDYWATQGVLLINSALTTVIGKPNEHADIWNEYVIEIIKKVAKLRPIIFMLWGNNAKSFEDIIVESNNKSIIYTWSHPSPMAQSRQSFINCPHFIDANKLLIKLGHEPIDWNTEPVKSDVEVAFHSGPKTQVVFTDGSCMPNKSCPASRGGYAASFTLGTMKDVILYGSIECKQVFASNQRAEGMAIWRTLMYLKDRVDEWEEVIIVTDSEFWIKMFEVYMPTWARTDKFSEKKNPDMTKPMYELYYELINEYGKTIEFRHIKSHGKDGWNKYEDGTYEYFCFVNNDYVDKLAGHARIELEPGNHIISNASYED